MLKLEYGIALDHVDWDPAILGVAEGLGLAAVVRAQSDQGIGAVQTVHYPAGEARLVQRLVKTRTRHAEREDAALAGGDGGAQGGRRRRFAAPLQRATATSRGADGADVAIRVQIAYLGGGPVD